MPTQNVHVIAEAFKNLEEVSDAFAVLQKQFRYMQEHIDVENIISKSLTAEVIKAGSITAGEITVDELSALSANLGTILAGFIYGTYIATRNGAYPRAEMSNTDNLFAAFSGPANYVQVASLSSDTSTPAVVMRDGSGPITGLLYVDPSLNELNLGSNKNIRLSSTLGGYTRLDGEVRVVSWDQVVNNTTGQTLYDALLTGPI